MSEEKSEKKLKKKKVGSLTSMKVVEDEPIDFLEPDEWYLAELEKAESNEGQYGPYVKFTFKILNGELENGKTAKGKRATRILDASLSPSKPLGQWAKVFLGRDLKVGESVNFTSYYGDKFRVLVKDKKPAKGGKSDGKRYQNVDTIKRPKKKEKEKAKE